MNTSALERPRGLALWQRQFFATLRIEIGRALFSRRSIPAWLAALTPIALSGLIFTLSLFGAKTEGSARSLTMYYFYLVLMVATFFGTAFIFVNLFRGDLLDRSLHFYFLTPMRRGVLAAGKFAAGLVAGWTLFGLSTAISLEVSAVAYRMGSSSVYPGLGPSTLVGYLLTTVLGVLGYGSVFLLLGLFVRSPLLPALALWGWESINFLLPPVLKRLSVVHYLKSIVPVPVDDGPFAVLSEPTSAWLSVPGLLLVAAIVLFLAARRLRGMEIAYSSE